MDVEALYNTVKNNSRKLDSIDINNTDANGYSLLHLSARYNDINFAKELMKRGVIYNSKSTDGKTSADITTDEQMKQLFSTIKLFFKAVKNGKHDAISGYITEEKYLINVKQKGGSTALHWAVNNANKAIVKLLLDNTADVFQVTEKGNTPLHIAVSRGNVEIVQLLLKNIPIFALFDFVNFKTFQTKSTCLHVSAEDGHLNIVKLLLQYGAIYNIENKVGSTPYDLSEDQRVKELLKLTNDIFVYALNSDDKLFSELKSLRYNTFEAVTKARDINKNTIQELAVNNHKDFVDKMNVLLKNHEQNYLEKDGWRFWELEALKSAAKNHERFSELYIPMLTNYGRPILSEINNNPWKMLKEGSYYLGNAYQFMTLYKRIRPSAIEDVNIKLISDTLDKLQFHPSHISAGYTEEAYGGEAECFVSKAEGSDYYYKLLHSKFIKDVKIFTDMVERSIDTPLKNFLMFIEKKLLLFPSYQLRKAIKENNILDVRIFLIEGADLNFEDHYGKTPLWYAVKYSSPYILEIILENGADVQHIYHAGDTILHIALNDAYSPNTTKLRRSFQIIKCLLKYGVVYNRKNQRGETPFDKCYSCIEAKSLLQKVEMCFQMAQNDDIRLVRMLQTMDNGEFDSVTRSRNTGGYTLLRVALTSGHNIENRFLEMIKKHKICSVKELS